MKFILDEVTVGTTERADTHDLVVSQADEEIHKPVQETVIWFELQMQTYSRLIE